MLKPFLIITLAVSYTANVFSGNISKTYLTDNPGCDSPDSTIVLKEALIRGESDHSNPLSGNLEHWGWDLEDISQLPSVLNTGDIMNLFKYLPNIQTASPLNGGLNVDGCEGSQTLIELDGMPIFNTTHLLGFFSTLNSSHFSKASLDMEPLVSDISHIGGTLSVSSSDSRPEDVYGSVNIGPLFSQGSLKVPIDTKSWINVSARASYLNLCYGWLLSRQNMDGFKYNFYDINADYNVNISDNDYLKIAFFRGHDNALFIFDKSLIQSAIEWGNTAASAIWRHKMDDGILEQSAYYSNYSNYLQFFDGFSQGHISSRRGQYGYNLVRNVVTGNDIYLKYGASFAVNNTTPFLTQMPNEDKVASSSPDPLISMEGCVYIKAGKYLMDNFYIEGHTRFEAFHSDRMYYGIDPGVSVTFFGKGYSDIKIQASINHQYLHNLSIVEVSLPAQSWIPASEIARPQKSIGLSLSYNRRFLEKNLSMSWRFYGKKLYNQVENAEFLWSYLIAGASSVPEVLVGDGYSFGAGASFQKTKGKLTGILSYNIGKSVRRFDEYGGRYFPASHDRLHDLKAMVDYRFSEKVSVSASWVYASGNPYTSPDCFYFIDGHLVCENGSHNNAHMPDYKRLDLSFEFRLPAKHSDCGFIISGYNVLCSKNPLIFRLSETNGNYSTRQVSFSACLPVINFYVRF